MREENDLSIATCESIRTQLLQLQENGNEIQLHMNIEDIRSQMEQISHPVDVTVRNITNFTIPPDVKSVEKTLKVFLDKLEIALETSTGPQELIFHNVTGPANQSSPSHYNSSRPRNVKRRADVTLESRRDEFDSTVSANESSRSQVNVPLLRNAKKKFDMTVEKRWDRFNGSSDRILDIEVLPSQQVVLVRSNFRRGRAEICDSNMNVIRTIQGDFYRVIKDTRDKIILNYLWKSFKVYDLTGNYLRDLQTPTLQRPRGAVMVSDTEMAVCYDWRQEVVWIDITTGAETAATPPGMFSGPDYITFNSRKMLLVSDWDRHCIKAIKRADSINFLKAFIFGSITTVFTYGSCGGGRGKLSGPHGVCCDSQDNTIVADSGNHRVSLISPTGQFIKHLSTKQDNGIEYPCAVALTLQGYALVGDDKGTLL